MFYGIGRVQKACACLISKIQGSFDRLKHRENFTWVQVSEYQFKYSSCFSFEQIYCPFLLHLKKKNLQSVDLRVWAAVSLRTSKSGCHNLRSSDCMFKPFDWELEMRTKLFRLYIHPNYHLDNVNISVCYPEKISSSSFLYINQHWFILYWQQIVICLWFLEFLILQVYSTSMAMLLTMLLSIFLFGLKPTLQVIVWCEKETNHRSIHIILWLSRAAFLGHHDLHDLAAHVLCFSSSARWFTSNSKGGHRWPKGNCHRTKGRVMILSINGLDYSVLSYKQGVETYINLFKACLLLQFRWQLGCCASTLDKQLPVLEHDVPLQSMLQHPSHVVSMFLKLYQTILSQKRPS